MAGATIFAVYTDGKGNVTVSPRDGTGHFEPQHSTTKTVTLLAGSKADATTVVANFKYSADEVLLQVQSASSPFIGSWKEGPAFNTADLAQSLAQHDDHSIYTLDLLNANVGESQNPFLGAVAVQPVGQPSQAGAGPDIALGKRLLKAHGILMGLAWLIVFPAGAILMRLRWGGVWAHVFIQVVGTSMVIAAFAIGYTFSGTYGIVSLFPHRIVGSWLSEEAHTNYPRSASTTPTLSLAPRSSASSSCSPSLGLHTTFFTDVRARARSSACCTVGMAARSSSWLSSMEAWGCSWLETRGAARSRGGLSRAPCC